MRRFAYWHEAVLGLMLVALCVAAQQIDPGFLTLRSQALLSTHLWEKAIIAVPVLLIVISGGIDLSVGSAVALCAVVLGLTYERGLSPWIGAGLAVAVGACLGLLNGWFVAKVKVHPLIVTLATLAAFRGIAEGISLARPISGFPASFGLLASAKIGGMPVPGLIFLAALTFAGVLLTRTPFGRTVFAIGHNETAARFSGLAVERVKMTLYAAAGAASGLAAAILVARLNTAKADEATGLELDVITAVVLGGASINGGRGNVLGLVLGLALIHETREFLSWHWHRDELNLMVIGGLLVLSVLLHRLLSPKSRTEDA